MFEQEELVRDDFADWAPPQREEAETTPAPDGDGSDAVKLDISAEEFAFSPDDLQAEAGQPVKVVVRNEGEITHNITIPELDVRSETIRPGESIEVTFTPDEPGDFTFFCRVSGHRDAGMEGTLSVEG